MHYTHALHYALCTRWVQSGLVHVGGARPQRYSRHLLQPTPLHRRLVLGRGLVSWAGACSSTSHERDYINTHHRYPTFCALSGRSSKDCTDDPPSPPLPVDPTDPSIDIWGNNSYPGLDGVNVWPFFASDYADTGEQPTAAAVRAAAVGTRVVVTKGGDYAAHASITVTAQVLVKAEHKFILGQGHASDSGEKTLPDWKGSDPPTDGWHLANGTWVSSASVGWKCGLAHGSGAVKYIPCLFNESADLREQHDLSEASPELMASLALALNTSVATWFTARSPASLMGKCDESCAKAHWKAKGGTGEGPICGVPGC
jgi:hypothetical protein